MRQLAPKKGSRINGPSVSAVNLLAAELRLRATASALRLKLCVHTSPLISPRISAASSTELPLERNQQRAFASQLASSGRASWVVTYPRGITVHSMKVSLNLTGVQTKSSQRVSPIRYCPALAPDGHQLLPTALSCRS